MLSNDNSYGEYENRIVPAKSIYENHITNYSEKYVDASRRCSSPRYQLASDVAQLSWKNIDKLNQTGGKCFDDNHFSRASEFNAPLPGRF